jgi:uncharacterized protein YlaI
MIIVLSFTAYPGTHDQHQSGHPSQPQHITHVVVTSQPTFIVHTFRESPVRTTCPDCRSDILTSTHRGSFNLRPLHYFDIESFDFESI